MKITLIDGEFFSQFGFSKTQGDAILAPIVDFLIDLEAAKREVRRLVR